QSTTSQTIGKPLMYFKPGLKNNDFIDELLHEAHHDDHWNGTIISETLENEKVNEQVSISAIRDESGNISNYISTFSDVTHLFQKQDQLEYLANHDVLTNLPNRTLLSDRLNIAIARAKRNNTSIAVCFLDLDGFKQVNDTFGHATGDLLLIEVAKRLQNIARTSDTVARVGGDEFVIIFDELKESKHCTPLLDRIIHEISQPFISQDAESLVSASIGVCFYPYNDMNSDELIKLADQAMYEAKRQGKSRYHFA
ncbi:MAG: GGDEF domain-containing protein, partial [Mariprofundaceae bacterium]